MSTHLAGVGSWQYKGSSASSLVAENPILGP